MKFSFGHQAARKRIIFYTLCASLLGLFSGCSSDDGGLDATTIPSSSSTETEEEKVVAVDYSLGHAMNKRLGRGINLGNSWDSKSYSESVPDVPYNEGYTDNLDAGWGNPIKDEYFQIVKDAGFNHVRIPVRFQHNSSSTTHTVNPERLAGVLDHVEKAIAAGLIVIVDFHHYEEMNVAANALDSAKPETVAAYVAERDHFFALWTQVAKELDVFPDSMLVLEIFNEPTFKSAELLNDMTTGAYEIIRGIAKTKTIMFQSNQAGKFMQLAILDLPQDGNIIFSGHYYEPFQYSHQGHGYDCKGDAAYNNTAISDLAEYAALAKTLYPDVNGGSVPLNMGEFGIAANSSCGEKGPSNALRNKWIEKTVTAAEKYNMSWTYWDFTKAGGFEAYDLSTNDWYPGILNAFFQTP